MIVVSSIFASVLYLFTIYLYLFKIRNGVRHFNFALRDNLIVT